MTMPHHRTRPREAAPATAPGDQAPARITPAALRELETLFPGDDPACIRITATPG
jgi:hypothetical protein